MKTKKRRANNERSLVELFHIVLTYKLQILAVTVLCMVVCALLPVSMISGPWEASGTFVLSHKDSETAWGGTTSTEKQYLSNLAAALMSSNRMYAEALTHMGSEMDPTELAQYVTIRANTQMLSIVVRHRDRDFAEQAVQAIMASAPLVVEDIVDHVRLETFGEIYTAAAADADTPLASVVFAGVLGTMAAVLVVVLLETANNTIRSTDELERLTEVPALGAIPSGSSSVRESARAIKKAEKTFRVPAYSKLDTSMLRNGSPAAFTDACEALLMEFTARTRREKLRRVVITSVAADEGAAEVAVHLALALAETGAKVVLLDCDLRRGMIRECLPVSVPAEKCLAAVLDSADDVQPAMVLEKGVYVIPAGETAKKPSVLLSAPRMAALLEELGQQFDYVICAAPPVAAAPDATVLGQRCDGVLVAVRYRFTDRSEVTLALQRLRDGEAVPMGTVLTDLDLTMERRMGRPYTYYGKM